MTQSTLFSTPQPEARSPPFEASQEGPFAAVALEQSIDKTLDYAIPPRLAASLAIGQRVRVPLGRNNRPALGYVVDIHAVSDYPKIKPLTSIADDRVLITPNLMELARWMSRYYVSPLGTVLDSILPSAVRKRVGLGYSQMVRLAQDREQVQALLEKTKAPKRRAILARLLLIEPGEAIELTRLAGEAGATPPTIRKLVRAGLITITPQADFGGLTQGLASPAGGEAELTLNPAQQTAVEALLPRIRDGGFSVNLLMGVTGSGKTEVYLRCIREAVDRGKRAIVLVPEIALTPQTVRRFTARFPNVAILHSGLTATNRHRFWQQVLTGHAQVVVGARSAVFAPTPDLGIIVVDEEHESSYKQDTAPRYHARDVAIKRAQLEGIPVLLGSATPSLEMYWRVKREEEGTEASATADRLRHEGTKGELGIANCKLQNSNLTAPQDSVPDLQSSTPPATARPIPVTPAPYHLLTLPARVRGLELAHVEVVDMKVESRFRKGVHLLSQRLEHLLRVTIESGRQAILLLNRRGYSNFVYCSSCTNAIQCKFCDTTMTYHRSAGTHAKGATLAEGLHTGQLHCHYCLAVNPLPDKCPHCGKKLSLFGLGTQRVEEELTRKFPELKFARVDSDSMRNARDYEALLERFARGEISVMLGTQMIAKGLDYPNVTLVGVVSGDTALALPDFRAAERTFQLITQVSGRAGRGDAKGRVVLQTFLPDDPAIQAAIRQDFAGFAQKELEHRREVQLPPFSRMVRIVLRDQEPEKLHVYGDELAGQLSAAIASVAPGIRMRGPMPCAINRIAGYWRNQIVLQCATAGPLQKVLAIVRDKGHLARNERIAVDVDPVSLL
jgi:primosomal protein N' (replication factor Y)